MEKVVVSNQVSKVESNTKILLENRNRLSLSGVKEVISSNENSIVLKIGQSKLVISGSKINISKLDVDSGLVEANGIFDSIKYSNSSDNILKRIFK